MSNKALVIAVSLLITMGIASAVLYTINQVMGVYKTVYETDTLIQSNFDEFDAYDGAEKTKLDLLNTLKKYKDNSAVAVTSKNKGDLPTGDDAKFNSAKDSISIDSIESELKPEGSSIKDGEKVAVNTSKASDKYNTYVERLSDGRVIIGFVGK